MMEVVWKSSMFGGYFIWIGLLVLYDLVQCIVSTDKTSLACVRNPSCNMTTLSCEDQHRISVTGHQYNYNEGSNQCTIDNSSNGCVIKEGCKRKFRRRGVYPLYTSCSGLNTCTVAATSFLYICTLKNGNKTEVRSDSTNVTYRCVNDRDILRFCKNRSTTTSNSVDIIFNGTDTHKSVQNQTCTCTVTGNSTDRIVLQDFRLLQPDNTSVCSSVKIKGFGRTCDATEDKWDNFVYLRSISLSVLTLENLFEKNANDRPTMVWIRVKAGGSAAPLTVNCTGAVQGETTPTVESPSTTKHSSGSATSTTTNPSRGSATSTTTNPSSGSATSTTTPSISLDTGTSVEGTISSSSASPNHARVTTDENKVPVAAIVVPLLLVLLGSAAAVTSVWFWRKRRKAATEENTNLGQQNVAYVTSGVSPGVSSGRISGTDRTYDLPDEGDYSTKDGNGLANSSCESDNYGYLVPAVAMRADDTPEYEVPVHVDGDGGEEHAYSILDTVDQQ